MTTEKGEHKATEHALNAIANWMRPPSANEGISYSIARLTTDAAIYSFIGGGDASIFTPSGHRGTLSSSVDGTGLLTPDFITATSFPITFTFDLNAGTAIGTWTNPVLNQAESVTITLEFNKLANDPDLGQYYIFTGDSSTDQAGYILTFVLL
ncbi:MAG: hypothetical protein ABSA06_03150 [Geobacteraceae bacterium]